VVPFTGCRTPPLLYYIAAPPPPPARVMGTSFGGGVYTRSVLLWLWLFAGILVRSSEFRLRPSLRTTARRDSVLPRVSVVRRARYPAGRPRCCSGNRARSRAPRLAGRDDQWRPDNPSLDLRSQYDSENVPT